MTAIRKRTELPTEAGWYYAKMINSTFATSSPTPVHVMHTEQLPAKRLTAKDKRFVVGEGLFVAGRLRDFQLYQFAWYGPVVSCQEKKS